MDLIKRHYEKLLLLGMLVLFIGIMIYVMQVAQRARSISDSDLRIPTFKADYEPQKSSDAQFNPEMVILMGHSDWKESVQREPFSKSSASVEGTFSDLVVPFAVANCPHCNNLVPRYYFSGKKCPACAGELRTPPSRPKQRIFIRTENDTDGDGMSNAYESQHGFNPQDPRDQLADADRDGFSNLFECENNTDPKNPRSRPPLWYRLRYISMEQVELPIRLMAVNTMDSQNKSLWNIQINKTRLNRWGRAVIDPATKQKREDTYNERLGSVIDIEGIPYKITEVEYKMIRKSKDSSEEQSTIKVVQQVKPDRTGKLPKADILVMQVRRPVKSNDKRLMVEDVGTETNRLVYVLREGDVIALGNRRTGIERYRLAKVNDIARTAEFSRVRYRDGEDPTRDRDGKKIVVTRESELPEDVQVKNVALPAGDAVNGPGR